MKWQLWFAAIAVLCVQTSLNAAPITYVDATVGDGGNTTLADGSVFTPATPRAHDDNAWSERAFGNGATVYVSNEGGPPDNIEDAPGLATTISGLDPGIEYDVFGYFWDGNGNWRLKASLTETPPLGNDLAVSFSANGSPTSTQAPLAIGDDFVVAPQLLTEGDRNLHQAALGRILPNANGEIVVYIDDLENPGEGGGVLRTWYDGVGFAAVPEPASFGLLVLGIAGMIVVRRR